MDREKAIQVLKRCEAESHCEHYKRHYCCIGCGQREALDLAIEALQESRTTHDQMDACYMAQKSALEKLQLTEETSTISEMESVEGVAESATTTDCISRADLPKKLNGVVLDNCDKIVEEFLEEHECDELWNVVRALRDFYEWTIDAPSVTPKPIMTEEVREALMRLSMCAREECAICKYENDCGFDKQVEMATKNMNTIINAFTERPKGEWEIKECDSIYGKKYILTCPECGGAVSVTEEALPYENFCRECGADMRGDKE